MSEKNSLPPLHRGSDAGSNRDSVRSGSGYAASGRGSVRSHRSGSAAPDVAGSVRSHQSSRAPSVAKSGSLRGSERSITSSVALQKLSKLEDMLVSERRAREQAENTLLAMQQEKMAQSAQSQRPEAGQEQLGQIMTALQRVLSAPADPAGIQQLQSLVRGAPVRTAATPPASRGAATPASQGKPPRAPVPAPAADEPQSFLDAIGQYDRDRKAKKRTTERLM